MARKQGSLTKTPNKNVKQFLAGYHSIADCPSWLQPLLGDNEVYLQALRLLDVISLSEVERYLSRYRAAQVKPDYSPTVVGNITREVRKISSQLSKELTERQKAAYAARDEALYGSGICLLTSSQKARIELLAKNYDTKGITDFTRRVYAQLKGKQL